MSRKLLIQVTLDRANRKKDRSVSLTFVTDLEQSSGQFMDIDQVINTKGILYFKSDGNLTQEELDMLNSVDIKMEGKTKSEMLRNTFWRVWKQDHEEEMTFNEYYGQEQDRVREHYKTKIEKTY